MTPWNRLRQLAERMIAGDERRAAADDAIYLSETAYRNSRPGAAAAPAIRERHFGIGARRRKAGEETAGIEAGKPRGLLARLGLRRQQAAPGDPAYAGTKLGGTPLPPSTPKAPAAAKKAATAPETPAVATAERPAAKPVSAPAVEPAVAAPRKAPSAPAAAPVIRPTPEKPVDDEAMLRHLFGEP